jgi:hypothetical protein
MAMSYTTNYLQSESVTAQGPEIIVLVNCMVQDAIKLSASDLHVEPWEKAIEVRARVNGVLTEVAQLPLGLLDKISTRFKVMSNLVTYQAGQPQDGTAIGGSELDGVQLRVSIFPTTRGDSLHREPAKTSREEIIPRGICRVAGKVRRGIRPTIHFQNRRGMIFRICRSYGAWEIMTVCFYKDVVPTALADLNHAAIHKSSANHSISPFRP